MFPGGEDTEELRGESHLYFCVLADVVFSSLFSSLQKYVVFSLPTSMMRCASYILHITGRSKSRKERREGLTATATKSSRPAQRKEPLSGQPPPTLPADR